VAADDPFQVDVGLWRKDPGLNRARPLTRGIWLEILMVMHERDACGEVCGTLKDLASDARCSSGEMRTVIDELVTHRIAEVTERNGIVTLRNRKMRRQFLARKSNQTRQQRYRERRRNGPNNAASNGGVATAGHVVVSKSSLGKEELSFKVNEVFVHWQDVMGHPNSKLTGERETKIRGRIAQGFTVEQLKRAVDGCKASEFHMGANDRNQVFDDIELICRNGSKVEQFMGFLDKPTGKTDPVYGKVEYHRAPEGAR
jgi:hypothetical protein